ncbi:beta-lactamase family protein [Antarcticibacterium flavum]|uniref:Beta-lactamase family protein n=1 Tax=Antarcticibacterium flavum TaxID=2058175 RepID=A0A5B7X8T0_9FLAO|nr:MULTISPECIES: serine hydrolase domain-containing protein [Antarcticibacterium]MCM4161477.1 peptidase [Antarcticibacterium sp. W02-3]QCY71063.1 beta-lactamase family protein [Antarcticibacterium flavum]
MKNFITLLFLVSGILLHAQTQEQNKKLDSLFDRIDAKDLAMGSISIFSNGKEAYTRSIGYLDLANQTPANSNTAYRIGSVTKTFTAVVIMQLIEEGKLEAGTRLSAYFPQVPNSDKITVEHLLRHQSGLFNITDDEDFRQWMLSPQSREAMLKRMLKNGTLFMPAEKTEYSNTNYLLLSYIAEGIEVKRYAEIVKQRIIDKLALKNTFYGGKIVPEKNQARSYAHTENGWELTPETDMSVPIGAGAMVSTPADLNKFYWNLFEGNLLSRASLDKMKTIEDGMGIGLMKLPLEEYEVYGHGGGIDGFSSVVVHFPQEKITAAFTSNGSFYQIHNLLIGTLKIIMGQDYELPETSPTIELQPEALEKYLGTYSSPDLPMKINIYREDLTLIAKATGQSPIHLNAVGEDIFKEEQLMLKLTFFPAEDKMLLEQGGQKAELRRE